MINIPISKILFIDIETVGAAPTFPVLETLNPELSYQFKHYLDWFEKRFPEHAGKGADEMFYNKSAIVAEFLKIVCISVGFVSPTGEIKTQSFYGDDEKEILKEVQHLLKKIGNLGFYLCGHNAKGFDIPVLAKRMMINGLMPPKILPSFDTKPWEVKAIDTKDIWQYGQFGSIASLELMCVSLGIESSKNMDVTGNKVHDAYWNDNNIEGITKYCERDVEVLIDVIKKLLILK
jgi:predicted PolB exonuclease-like 3'-5' exonuclease